jgi:hypothetical protein
MKKYRVEVNVKISEQESFSICNYETFGIVVSAKNKLEAINKAIQHISCVTHREDFISERLGRKYVIKNYALERINSVEIYKG